MSDESDPDSIEPLGATPDIYALLRRIESTEPKKGKSLHQEQVDRLLGREGAEPAVSSTDEEVSTDADPHAWFRDMVVRTPEVPDTFRVLRAARAIEAGVLADERLEYGISDPELRAELVWLSKHGREEFRLLVEGNVRLVFHWARRMQIHVGEHLLQDAFQAGCLGLMRGIQGWDHTRGFTLSTYVSWHIRQSIQRWRHDETTVIRVPVHVWEKLRSDDEDLSAKSRAAAENALTVGNLDEVELDLPELVWDGGLEAIEDAYDRERLAEVLLDCIPEREAQVLRLRYGFSASEEPATLDQIGRVFGVTRERIRQIETKAIKALREMFADYDGVDYSY